jgi:hypothetical protein
MPLFYLFTGILPVGGDQHAFLIRLFPYIGIAVLAFELLSRGTGYLLLSERFTMVRVYTYMLAVLALFTRKPLKFNVTPKGHSGVPRSAYMPQLVLLGLSIAAPIWATIAYHERWVNYSAPGWGAMAFWMNGMWAAWNCYFAYYVVRHSLAMRQQRDNHRFDEITAIEVMVEREGVTDIIPAMTANLNSSGVGFRSTQRVEPGTKVTIDVPLGTQRISTTGEVRHVETEQSHLGTVYAHGVAFGELSVEARDAIELYCAHHSMPVWRMRYRQSIDILTRCGEVVRNLRGGRRRLVGLPANVTVQSDLATEPAMTRTLVLEDLGAGGARLIGDTPFTPGTSLSFTVPGSNLSGSGVVRHVQLLQTDMAMLFSIGVAFNTLPTTKRHSFSRFVPLWLLSGRRDRITETVPVSEIAPVPPVSQGSMQELS